MQTHLCAGMAARHCREGGCRTDRAGCNAPGLTDHEVVTVMSSTAFIRIARGSLGLLAAQALAFAALAQTSQPANPSAPRSTSPASTRSESAPVNRDLARTISPQAFTEQAALIGRAEIEIGKVALANASAPEVRQYAEQMVKDHTAAADKLSRIAAKEKLQVPQTLDGEHAALKQRLSGLKGESFDREYSKAMAKGHDKAVALFESASQATAMPDDLKEFAAATLPTLELHRALAHTLHEKDGA
jgi:putative membrane protein